MLRQKSPVCFLRHDIDFSPKNALRMAQLERQHDISSTYTVLLTGQYYNAFEKDIQETLKEKRVMDMKLDFILIQLFTTYLMNYQCRNILKKRLALSDIIGAPISMFSFHNTTDFTRNCRAQAYSGLVNAYSNFFHNDVEYTSDSNGYWRFRTWKELLLENHKIIQVLTSHLVGAKNEFPFRNCY